MTGPTNEPALPPRLEYLPGRDAVGRVYALYDCERGAEVCGTVVACWPERGPTWAVRLHELDPERRLVMVYLYERPESRHGRWFITREIPMPKSERYAALVAARKAHDSEGAFGLANPASVAGGRFDSAEVGPWTRWAGDLDAALMVVGQDWGDVAYFEANQGLDQPHNPTSVALAGLLAHIGRSLPLPSPDTPPDAAGTHRRAGVFLTNALLWLKRGGMSAPVREDWFSGDNAIFLLEQIALVQPRVVVALGQRAHAAILRAYDLPVPSGPYRTVVEQATGTPLPGVPCGAVLYGVYHCGARVRNTLRSMDQQRCDWLPIARALQSS